MEEQEQERGVIGLTYKLVPDNSTVRRGFFVTEKRLESLIFENRYEEAWVLFDAIRRTNRYAILDYWKTGLEILKKLRPDEAATYLEYAFTSCRLGRPEGGADDNKRSLPAHIQIFHAWMEELLNRKEYTRVVEEIRLQLRFAVKDPEIQRILAIARYWMWKDDNTNEPLLNEAVTTLAVAHAAFPNDAEMLWKYLDALGSIQQQDGRFERVCREALAQALRTHDTRIALVVLQHYKPDMNCFKDWLTELLPVFELDPGMDVELFLKPAVEVLLQRCDRYPAAKSRLLGIIYGMLVDRLEFSCADDWTLDTLQSLLSNIVEAQKAGNAAGIVEGTFIMILTVAREVPRTVESLIFQNRDTKSDTYQRLSKDLHPLVSSIYQLGVALRPFVLSSYNALQQAQSGQTSYS